MVSIYLSDEALRQNTDGILQIHTKNQTELDKYHISQHRYKVLKWSGVPARKALRLFSYWEVQTKAQQRQH